MTSSCAGGRRGGQRALTIGSPRGRGASCGRARAPSSRAKETVVESAEEESDEATSNSEDGDPTYGHEDALSPTPKRRARARDREDLGNTDFLPTEPGCQRRKKQPRK